MNEEVWVVMSNDFPDRVFRTQEDAAAYCALKNSDPTNNRARRIRYAAYGFKVLPLKEERTRLGKEEGLTVGKWVVAKDGRVGQIYAQSPRSNGLVIQFGTGGPFETHAVATLRLATEKQIAKKEGCA